MSLKARIPPQNRLDPEIMAIIEELSQKKAQAKVDEMQAERDEITIRKVLKAVIVRCNSLFGIGAERALRLIEAVNHDMVTEDPEEVWRRIDGRLEQMGLDFYEKEAY